MKTMSAKSLDKNRRAWIVTAAGSALVILMALTLVVANQLGDDHAGTAEEASGMTSSDSNRQSSNTPTPSDTGAPVLVTEWSTATIDSIGDLIREQAIDGYTFRITGTNCAVDVHLSGIYLIAQGIGDESWRRENPTVDQNLIPVRLGYTVGATYDGEITEVVGVWDERRRVMIPAAGEIDFENGSCDPIVDGKTAIELVPVLDIGD